FHLVCDATNPEAIDRLRERKHREEKPFALMMASIKGIKKVCEVSSLEERLLKSPESPIVLLKRKASPTGIFSLQHRKIAPENPWLGIMLPYTPLHHLLMRELSVPIVATSGNISEEPMCIDENQALRTLGGIADVFLIHNRPIVRHVDDSIARIIMGREMILRRARGYAPLPVQLNSQPDESSHNLTPSLAVGGHLKNTIAIAKGNSVFISQHIGDLSTQESLNTFERVIQDFQRLYRIEPEHYVIDMHPDYLSGKYARSHFDDVRAVQHHEAHIAACRAENQVSGKALGVSWDGTGFGRDETIWGGEFFISDEKNHKRIAHFRNFPLPGSDEAIREPRRSALGILYEIFGSGIFDHNSYIREHFSDKEILFLRQMLAKGYNSPRTSSVGRLFDAVAALLNVRQKIAYEGQAAMMLEFLVDENEGESYQVSLEGKEPLIVNWEVMIRQILTDVESGLKKNRIAARFHTTLANVILAVARTVNLEKVVLSGGCFQNTILLEKTIRLLQKHQFHPYWHQRIPPNDGGISLGQTVLGRDTGAPENAPGGRYNFADLKMNQ
ncbi:MAG: carbamoyltransferase HypF, partial [Calditrichaeota bacterium]